VHKTVVTGRPIKGRFCRRFLSQPDVPKRKPKQERPNTSGQPIILNMLTPGRRFLFGVWLRLNTYLGFLPSLRPWGRARVGDGRGSGISRAVLFLLCNMLAARVFSVFKSAADNRQWGCKSYRGIHNIYYIRARARGRLSENSAC